MESYENSNLSCLTLSWKILFLSEKEKKKKKKNLSSLIMSSVDGGRL